MKNEKKLKKEGQKGLIGLRSQKPFKKFEGKRQKKCALSLDQLKRERKTFEKSLNSDRTHEKLMILKTL